ncbi:MAG: hypothetical protein IPO35_17490 [Uliginosibacterium sp.]|nr:hypothetical protein [Uliginosibacterium sp.]
MAVIDPQGSEEGRSALVVPAAESEPAVAAGGSSWLEQALAAARASLPAVPDLGDGGDGFSEAEYASTESVDETFQEDESFLLSESAAGSAVGDDEVLDVAPIPDAGSVASCEGPDASEGSDVDASASDAI